MNDTLTCVEFFVHILLNAQQELQYRLVVVAEFVGEQGVNNELPVDKTNTEPGFDFRHVSSGDVVDLEGKFSQHREATVNMKVRYEQRVCQED